MIPRKAAPVLVPTRILVVDDEPNIAFLVSSALRWERFEVATAATGREAISLLTSTRPQLVVLDVMLPDLDGFELLVRMRRDGHRMPVIFLTARDATDDRVRGLGVGGDDYLVKPFAIEELIARVHAVLRRSGLAEAAAGLRYSDLEMDDDAHLVFRAGREISLSPTEYKLLRYFLMNAGRVLSRAQILDHVWDYDYEGDVSVVDTYVSYLRKKIDSDGPSLLRTVRGVGYSLRIESTL